MRTRARSFGSVQATCLFGRRSSHGHLQATLGPTVPRRRALHCRGLHQRCTTTMRPRSPLLCPAVMLGSACASAISWQAGTENGCRACRARSSAISARSAPSAAHDAIQDDVPEIELCPAWHDVVDEVFTHAQQSSAIFARPRSCLWNVSPRSTITCVASELVQELLMGLASHHGHLGTESR